MTSTLLVGAIGLVHNLTIVLIYSSVGLKHLATLLAHPAISSISTLSRRELKSPSSDKLQPLVSDNSDWASEIASLSQTPSIFFSGLGTTRGKAGSFAAQRKIDYNLNLELATAAKEKGVRCYVLISSGGASSTSMLGGYTKTKGELEDSVKALDSEKTVILRPGLIMGEREEPTNAAEGAFKAVVGMIGKVSPKAKDGLGQEVGVIAKAAVNAGLKAVNEGLKEKVWIMGQADIVRLGRTEWTDGS